MKSILLLGLMLAVPLTSSAQFSRKKAPPTKGKSLAVLGNSIVMSLSTYYPHLPTQPGDHDDQDWRVLKQILQLKELINCGIGGATWQDRGDENITDYPLRGTRTATISNQLRMLKRLITEEKRKTPDIILIAAGTNNPNVDGDFDTVMKMSFEELEANEAYRQTMYGGLRYSLEMARREYSDATIYLVTPMQSNSAGRSYDKIKATGDAIKEMGARYSCMVFDAASEIGIVDLLEKNGENGRYLSDGIHLNFKGKKKYTKWIAQKILQNYY